MNIKSAGKIKETDGFNPDDMQFQDIKLNMKNAKYIAEDLGIENLNFSVRDSKNFELKRVKWSNKF